MATSTNGVFHYTSKMEYLQSILSNGFFPSYCKETIYTGATNRTFATSMVSFCDIPLSQVKDHMGKYGDYALGMTMEWVMKNGLNPVQYLERNSTHNKGIHGVLNFIHEDWHEVLEEGQFDKFYDTVYKGAIAVLQSMKNFSGPLIRDEVNHGEYKFYDEREWRYAPIIDIEHVTDYPDLFWEEDFEELKTRFPNKPHFKDYGIMIGPGDIRYILVKDDSEIPEMIAFLHTQHKLFATEEQFQVLLTRIKTAKQIKEDF